MSRIQGDLKERTLAFGERVLRMLRTLPQENAAWIVAKQLGRSGTSVGANVWEADHAHSDAKFAQKISIARKESSETEYWLTLTERTGLAPSNVATPLLKEAGELTRILAAIVVRTQQHIAGTRR